METAIATLTAPPAIAPIATAARKTPAETEKSTSVDEINQVLRDAANGPLKGILAYSDEELVSIDFNHNAHSSIVDTTYTRSTGGNVHKVLSWYDNEWGYSNRVLDLISHVARVRKDSLASK